MSRVMQFVETVPPLVRIGAVILGLCVLAIFVLPHFVGTYHHAV